MSGKNTGKILSLIFVRKSKDKETFSAPDFLTHYYRSSPFEMSSIYEAANRIRNFSIAFFSIRDTYELRMPSRAATCFCVYSAFPPRPYRRRSTCFSCSFNSESRYQYSRTASSFRLYCSAISSPPPSTMSSRWISFPSLSVPIGS